jgi:rhamnose utilization protein RhaD (predicted bifunctional aldolase and dehydrogenase)
MSEIKDFVEISKYAGERLDLVQAAGGNSSVKLDNGEMLIKASGFLLSDVTINTGYSKVLTASVAAIVKNEDVVNISNKRQKESLTAQLLKTATVDKQNRPSIETLLHSLLLKYTLHTHSIVVNMIVVQDQWKDILNSIFKDSAVVLVKYETPGIELAIALDKELQRFDKIPNIIILQNHGLIVTSDKKEEIKIFTEYVLKKIERYLMIDMSRYKLTNDISHLYNNMGDNSSISYLSEDVFLNEQLQKKEHLFSNTPFCPDTFVYCGVRTVIIASLNDTKSLEDYKMTYHQLPKVIIYDCKLFFRASTLKKAKEMEEVLKFHIMVLARNENKSLNFLEKEELDYLSNWEAEKYRQKL